MMKTMKSKSNYKVILITLVLGLLTMSKLIAQNVVTQIEDEKEVSPSSVIYITNSTDIEIHTWAQQKVKHIVEISIDPVDRSKAQELAKQFDFKIQTTFFGNTELEYGLGINKMGEFSDSKIKTPKGEITVVLNNGKTYTVKNIKFNIVVYIPRNNELVLNSKFSNVSLGDLSNQVELDLTGVTLKANNINKLTLDASYSNIWFDNLNDAYFDTKHCEINVADIKNAEIKSEMSNFQFASANKIEIEKSIAGTIDIKKVSIVNSNNSSYTNFSIGELYSSTDISSKHGDITIEDVDKKFSYINISNSFSTINISALNVEAFILNTNTEYTKFNLNKDIHSLDSKDRIKNFYKGAKSANQKISIDCSSCNINFK